MRYVIPNNMRDQYIATNKPFKSGRMRGMLGTVYGFYGRLPGAWREVYRRDSRDIVYTVLSYDTPIAWLRENTNGTMTWFIPSVSYSNYTSVHQNHVRKVTYLKRYVSQDAYATVADIDNRYIAITEHGANPLVFPKRRMITGRTMRSIKNGDYVFFSGFGWCVVYDKFKSKTDAKWYVTTYKHGTPYYQDITDIASFLRD
jgi:hypothetical protein